MKFYVELRPVARALSIENRQKVQLLMTVIWQIVSCRQLSEDVLRSLMYDKISELSSKDRQEYLRKVYEPNLRKIGSDYEVIQRIKYAAIRMDFDVTTESCKITFTLRDTGLTDVVDIIYGDGAFRVLAEPSRFCRRPVYVNRATGEHYIKDDLGVLTKRYAFRSGNKLQYNKFRQTGTSRRPVDKNLLDSISTPVLNNHMLSSDTPNLQEAIYIHQRYGSGEEQRGVCLSTTPPLHRF